MPGKYSHSIVLADYSSRGLIVLPPEQQTIHVNSSSHLHKNNASQMRLHGTSPGSSATPTRPQVDLPADEDAKRIRPTCHPRRDGQKTNNIPAMPGRSHQEPKTAYKRQQQQQQNTSTVDSTIQDPGASKRLPRVGGTSKFLAPADNFVRPAFRNSRSYTSLRKEPSGSNSCNSLPVATPDKTSGFKTSAPRSGKVSESRRPAPDKTTSRDTVEVGSSKYVERQFTQSRYEGTSDLTILRGQAQPRFMRNDTVTNGHAQKSQLSIHSHGVSRSNSDASKGSRHTQIWDPKPPIEEEPDFDNFSDAAIGPSGYFDVAKRRVIHSRDSSLDSTLPIQRPESLDQPKSQSRTSNVLSVPSARATPTSRNERSTPSRATVSSTIDSSLGGRSNSSVSSISMLNGHMHQESGKPPESVQKQNHTTSTDLNWRLPEIQEDHGFSPSIFEDQENASDRPKFDPFDVERSIGQISSGKDVSFNENDAASELSAALPPPITRFKDEEDEFNANMAKLFGEGGDYAINKKGSHTIGRTSARKGKGFFSKFRSKSQPPGK